MKRTRVVSMVLAWLLMFGPALEAQAAMAAEPEGGWTAESLGFPTESGEPSAWDAPEEDPASLFSADGFGGFLADPKAEELPEEAVPIFTAEDLSGIFYSNEYYYLVNDIVLPEGWQPIESFSGTLDGRGHRISNLTITPETPTYNSRAGLICYLNRGAVKNLHVEISEKGLTQSGNLGGIVGYSQGGSLYNCYVTGGPVTAQETTVPAANEVRGFSAGGLAGFCTANGTDLVEIQNCYATVDVGSSGEFPANPQLYLGGLVGQTLNTSISRCFATGDVRGYVPELDEAHIVNCGGLVGNLHGGSLENSYATGMVSSSSRIGGFAGGLVGYYYSASSPANCYAAGDVSSEGLYAYRGTLFGASYRPNGPSEDFTVSCYYPASQSVTGDHIQNIQGVLLTEEQMRSAASFVGWDFETVWTLDPAVNGGYPSFSSYVDEVVNPPDPAPGPGFLADPRAEELPEGAVPISTAEALSAIDGRRGDYYLANDIALPEGWQPIKRFSGTLDGRGHCISNLTITESTDCYVDSTGAAYAGLFCEFSYGTIRNLHVQLSDRGATHSGRVGGLVGCAGYNTALYNCFVTGGAVTATGGNPCAGGLIGCGNSLCIEDCYAAVNVSIGANTGESQTAGGLAGRIGGQISRCFASGNVTFAVPAGDGRDYELVYGGGLAGDFGTGQIFNCFATGNVTVTFPAGAKILNGFIRCGGLVGNMFGETMEDCYARGEVSIIALNVGEAYGGGLAGYCARVNSIARCYASGNVACVSGTEVFDKAGTLAGGSANCPENFISSSYYPESQTVTAYNDSGVSRQGVPLTEEQMRSAASFAGWDFETVWTTDPAVNDGYPSLRFYNGPVSEPDPEPSVPPYDGQTYNGFLQDPLAASVPAEAVPISSAAGLQTLADSDGTYYLTGDIILTRAWTPIENFRGTLYGQGHRIIGLYIPESAQEDYAGLFGTLDGAEIRDLAVFLNVSGINAVPASDKYSSYVHAGGLAAYAAGESRIVNCFVTGGQVSAQVKDSTARSGGLVGSIENGGGETTITDCYAESDVRATGEIGDETGDEVKNAIVEAGGLVGHINGGSIERCFASGSVSASASPTDLVYARAGGLIGYLYQTSILNCYARGGVTASSTGSTSAGGISPVNAGGSIENCYATGDVTSTGYAERCSQATASSQSAAIISPHR